MKLKEERRGAREERTSLSPLRVNKRKLKREGKRKGNVLHGEIVGDSSIVVRYTPLKSWPSRLLVVPSHRKDEAQICKGVRRVGFVSGNQNLGLRKLNC